MQINYAAVLEHRLPWAVPLMCETGSLLVTTAFVCDWTKIPCGVFGVCHCDSSTSYNALLLLMACVLLLLLMCVCVVHRMAVVFAEQPREEVRSAALHGESAEARAVRDSAAGSFVC